ncbi:hypothetical protein L1987_39763 [Smallanthus sonchifolius]|uniref:Uncharacterized protein n=1 Tax=Smallanthus sonchifolius TaxID=185202 RepID=A0ACB9HP30_9ASTR|nr:hypothetical protein L1987_39763 [Smallanthus sonchifolius]
MAAPPVGRLLQELTRVPSRWLSLFAGIFLQMAYDFTTTYAIITPTLHQDKNLTVLNLTTVAFIKNIATNFSLLVGLVFFFIISTRRMVPVTCFARFGFIFTVLLAAVFIFLGYLLIWLDITDKLKAHKALYHVFVFCVGHSTSIINSANFTISMMNFSNHHGTVIGLMQGYFHISGSIFMDLNKVFFQGHMGDFLIFMAVFPPAVSIICSGFIKINPYENPDNVVERGFRHRFIYSGSVIGLTIVIVGLLDHFYDFKRSNPWMVVVSDVLLFIAISFPILVHVWTAAGAPPVVVVAPPPPSPAAGDEVARIGLSKIFKSSRFWFLLISSALATGAYSSLFDNINFFAKPLKLSEPEVMNIISISSGLSFLGSLIFGVVSDRALKSHGCGRPWFLTVSTVFMIGGHIICRFGHLFIGASIVGAFYKHLALLPVIAVELFSLQDCDVVLPALEIAKGACSLLLSLSVVFQDKSHKKIHGGCYGKDCFIWSYWSYAIVCLVAFLLSLILGCLTQQTYLNAQVNLQNEGGGGGGGRGGGGGEN